MRVSELYENFFSRTAKAHFAVTNAMSRTLQGKYSILAEPLHDRPSEIFQPLSAESKRSFLSKSPVTAPYAKDLEEGSMRLIVSPTSWTADEDFSILLEALVQYSADSIRHPNIPTLLAIITGKGPLKEHYTSKIKTLEEKKKLHNVVVRTAWLTASDYSLLLGSADVGISLHTSSSGVDLPMKVVDMFGTGLPVFGWSDFEAWGELVKEDFNGKGFTSAHELADLLVRYLETGRVDIDVLREGATKECSYRWDDEWDIVAGKLFGLCQ